MNAPTLDYIAEVAKDWVTGAFAAAEDSDFALAPHRFELDGHTVRRHRLAAEIDLAEAAERPAAWVRKDVVTVRGDAGYGRVEYEQEIVEILGVEDDDVLEEAAFVVRIPGLPPCLGPFWQMT